MTETNTQELPEILLIDKPKGISSFDVIRRLKRKFDLPQKGIGKIKIGHAGTLDPLASGLMVIGIGKGTKQLTKLIKLDKTYEAEIVLGEKRTTGDLEGEILEECEVLNIDKKEVEKVLNEMKGVLKLPVPVYSAIKQGGQALYKKARKGEEVEPPVKEMDVQGISFNKLEEIKNRTHVFVNFDVGSGTYIRSLAEEFGRRLNLPATLGNLRRTKVGKFDIKDSENI